MPARIRIEDRRELSEFVRTHLGHRLTAMVAPFCLPASLWSQRNDAYRAAKEGSYSMLRMFIEFLGVKSEPGRKANGTKQSLRLAKAAGPPDTIHIDAFGSFGAKELDPAAFGPDEDLIARVHRTLCKINAHFTYDQEQRNFYDRIASPDDETVWNRAVDIVVQKLDEHFYCVVSEDIVVHLDLERTFIDHFKTRLGLRSRVKGDGLGRP